MCIARIVYCYLQAVSIINNNKQTTTTTTIVAAALDVVTRDVTVYNQMNSNDVQICVPLLLVLPGSYVRVNYCLQWM